MASNSIFWKIKWGHKANAISATNCISLCVNLKLLLICVFLHDLDYSVVCKQDKFVLVNDL